jgi:two-component system sensor histidine kinase and response regulator WspE
VEDLSRLSMLELFQLEVDAQTSALSAAILAAERGGGSAAESESMMRSAHSLKGAARIIGLEPAERVAHALEEIFAAIGRGEHAVSPAHADALLAGIDFLASIARADDALTVGSPWADRAAVVAARLAALDPRPRSGADAAAASASPAPPSRPTAGAAPAAEATAASPAVGTPDRVVRISADSLSRLVALAGEAVVETRALGPLAAELRGVQKELRGAIATADPRRDTRAAEARLEAVRQQAEKLLAALSHHASRLDAFTHRSVELAERMQQQVLASRMRPFAEGIRGLPRMVREMARSLGKQARLEIRGEQTGVDRDILDRLEAALSHLIRNALDHGIEPPDVRQAAGKPAVGTVVLEARHRAGMLAITVSDDGAGVDLPTLRSTAIDRGIVPAPAAARLSDAELLDLLFLPGLSTRDNVTAISGRGVGLDAVRSFAKACGGSLRVASEPGRQTAFTLQLPITMSVMRGLLVDIAGDPYAFPLPRIDRILQWRAADVRTVEGRQYIDHDGSTIGLVLTADVLELPARPTMHDPLLVVVITERGRPYGFIVDAFLGERDLEVRPLDHRLGRIPDVAAASLLEDGSPVLIIDVDDLARSVDGLLAGRQLRPVTLAAAAPRPLPPHRKRILVVDDSITVRELERQLLAARGFLVDVAADGMEAWEAVRATAYDLVVTDVDMPRLDGIGLVTLIKADAARRSMPVVILSYKDREQDRLRGLDAGANRYLTKTSFHDDTFVRTIIDLIGEPLD